MQVSVSFTDDAGNPETVVSASTGEVRPENANIPATGRPVISGEARVGQTLSVDTSGIEDADGLEDADFTYQWLAGGTNIEGADAASYTLTTGQLGKAISVEVSFDDDRDNAEPW